VEAADDIVYLAADVEDAVKKGILSWTDVEEKLELKSDSVQRAIKGKEAIPLKLAGLKYRRTSMTVLMQQHFGPRPLR
jgi:dGTP triphosphohydrolase